MHNSRDRERGRTSAAISIGCLIYALFLTSSKVLAASNVRSAEDECTELSYGQTQNSGFKRWVSLDNRSRACVLDLCY